MKFLALVLFILIGSAIWAPKFVLSSAQQPAVVSISPTDPDFSIVLFPDTQYYNSQNAYVFKDQANWVVGHQAALNIKMVVGLGDIIDGGGYPVDSNGNKHRRPSIFSPVTESTTNPRSAIMTTIARPTGHSREARQTTSTTSGHPY